MKANRKTTGLPELQAWYLADLRPKLMQAAATGAVTPGAAGAFDNELRAILRLPDRNGGEAA
jgi:uncharacterized protein YciW